MQEVFEFPKLYSIRQEQCSGLTQHYFAMDKGQIEVFESGTGICIRITKGTAWITQEGLRKDFVVKAGETWKSNRDGRIVIQGI